MFDSVGRMKAIHDMDDSTAGAIASVETDELRQEGMSVGVTRKVKLLDKVAALNMAMKFFGMFEKDNNQKQPVVLQMTQVDVDL
jgi:phage terminase small subunit